MHELNTYRSGVIHFVGLCLNRAGCQATLDTDPSHASHINCYTQQKAIQCNFDIRLLSFEIVSRQQILKGLFSFILLNFYVEFLCTPMTPNISYSRKSVFFVFLYLKYVLNSPGANSKSTQHRYNQIHERVELYTRNN